MARRVERERVRSVEQSETRARAGLRRRRCGRRAAARGDEQTRGERPPQRAAQGATHTSPPSSAEASVSLSAELSFLAKLAARSQARDSILCVGLDPEPSLIPASFGREPRGAVRFLRRIIRATAEHVCAYKPNLAFYERYGTAAMD